MIPYMGCKEFIAKTILDKIPPAENFYDLFGGGGSISETAINTPDISQDVFGRENKWQNIYYNEINTGVCLLNKAIWEETFDYEKAYSTWISREDYVKAKEESHTAWDTFVRLCWSYGDKGNTYIYGEKIEIAKMLLHIIHTTDLFFDKRVSYKDRQAILVKNLSHHIINQAKVEKQATLKRNTRPDEFRIPEYDITISGIVKNRQIQKVARIQNSQKVDMNRLFMSNLDYREVEIKPNSVVYCDIPYNTEHNDNYYKSNFDWLAFFDWAISREFPVYFSEYTCSDNRFKCVLEVDKRNSLNKKRTFMVTERLFWNGKEIRK